MSYDSGCAGSRHATDGHALTQRRRIRTGAAMVVGSKMRTSRGIIHQAAELLHHSWAEGHVLDGLASYATVFFAIWWAWMTFTWFASAYDCTTSRTGC